uniref:Uncharacterized protein n=1 Tax=Palpitomonas bilix TaxID=652834 RepID=A0A7S3DM01_9EUKA|mmetsp:Transcript_4186/g.8256  ORF Transcript_4186/g.8256 Transcript_4186/m.8256 type:complete len:171 (+) Transcript_4186:129-641(+)
MPFGDNNTMNGMSDIPDIPGMSMSKSSGAGHKHKRKPETKRKVGILASTAALHTKKRRFQAEEKNAETMCLGVETSDGKKFRLVLETTATVTDLINDISGTYASLFQREGAQVAPYVSVVVDSEGFILPDYVTVKSALSNMSVVHAELDFNEAHAAQKVTALSGLNEAVL